MSTTITEKLITISNNVSEVYKAGQTNQYNNFWDNYQVKGNRKDYNGAFAGTGWTEDTFKPKYNLTGIEKCQYMFFMTGLMGDLDDLLPEGIKLDTSKSIQFTQMFYNAKLEKIGTIDAAVEYKKDGKPVPIELTNTFAQCPNLTTIKTLKVSENNTFKNTFNDSKKLESITFEGKISNDISFVSSPLTVESAKSAIMALDDSSVGKTITFSETTKGFLNNLEDGKIFPNTEGEENQLPWDEYIPKVKGWSFA